MMARYNQSATMTLVFCFSISFGLATLGMGAFHTYLILTNKSTVEMESLAFENPFNQGYKENWE